MLFRSVPWQDLDSSVKAFVMEGEPGFGSGNKQWPRAWYGVNRFFGWLEENTYKMHVRVFLSRYRSYVTCPSCSGTRLQPDSHCWKWKGKRISDLYQMPVRDLLPLIRAKAVRKTSDPALELAREAIINRLTYLSEVGLDYLTLNRSSRSLSGGETQRVNLTSCIGTSLVDTLYILDEPSIGLHARDHRALLDTLVHLRNIGNTVLVVEHDADTIRSADWVIDLGPEGGEEGGRLVATGTPEAVARSKTSYTGHYLQRFFEMGRAHV